MSNVGGGGSTPPHDAAPSSGSPEKVEASSGADTGPPAVPEAGDATPNLGAVTARTFEGGIGLVTRSLLILASLTVIVAGLRAAQAILVPICVSAFLAMLSVPLVSMLRRRGLPAGLAVGSVMALDLFLIAGVAMLLASSLNEFTAAVPRYRLRLEELFSGLASALNRRGWDIEPERFGALLDPAAWMSLLAGTLQGMASLLTNLVLILLTLLFILLEVSGFSTKLRRAPGDPRKLLRRFSDVTAQVQNYLGLKALISSVTGLLLGGWVALLGIDFPLLWGLLAFILNFVPNLGSIMAAIPPVLLATLQFGGGRALLVALGYLVVNMSLGNVVEPLVLGRRLGLSPLAVFLSLVVWGWIWGPVGMLMAVPLVMVGRIVLEASPQLSWISVMLASGTEEDPRQPSAGRHRSRWGRRGPPREDAAQLPDEEPAGHDPRA